MQLRDHPKIRHWPPTWGGPYGPGHEFVLGEDAPVKGVRLVGPDHIGPARLYLDIEYKGNKDSGFISTNNPTFMVRLYDKVNEELKARRARSVHDIGNMEIDF